MEDKPVTALCGKCNKRAPMAIEARPVEGLEAVTEWVVVCSLCGHAGHSCWMSAGLETMQREIEAEHHPVRKAKLGRRYNRKFEEFQHVMERRAKAVA